MSTDKGFQDAQSRPATAARRAFEVVAYYPNVLAFDAGDPAQVEEFVQTAAAAGVTHLQVNHLADRMHPEQCSQPDNFYLSFANFGPSLDLFVHSELNRGLYPDSYLERNRRCLLRFAAAARQHGLRPLLYLCEPKFVPERFFTRHPLLRGPRVDNPGFSRVPLYALCSDKLEVLEHYREMMAKMMALVPDLAMVTLFTSDSGSGFDYNPDLYAGPNGPRFNRDTPLEERVIRLLSVLLEEGRRADPGFTINLTSGFNPADRERILAAAPAGIVGSVYGLYDWAGGLEEMWAYHQYRGRPWAIDREQAFAARLRDMRERFTIAARGGKSPLVHAEVPTNDYPRPLRYTPHPYETIKLVRAIRGVGASAIALWGRLSPARLVPWDVNRAAMLLAMDGAAEDADQMVARLAEAWVGADRAPLLCQAWRLCDRAITQRPNWRHMFSAEPDAVPGPLVPDFDALAPRELAYYRTLLDDDLEATRGGPGWFVPREQDERVRDYVLNEMYAARTFPAFAEALAALDEALVDAPRQAAEVLRSQRDHIAVAALWLQSGRNWYELGRHLAPGTEPSAGRTVPEIVDDEIAVTRGLIELLDGGLDRLLATFDMDTVRGCPGPGFVAQLRQRIQVMRAHRDDPPAIVPAFRSPAPKGEHRR